MPGNYSERGSRQALPDPVTPHHWTRARVLVVDDHCTYRWLLGSLLEKLGVPHLCCGDGQQAIHALTAEHFDLVISDCRMPVMDGYAMTRQWRRREHVLGRPPVAILALTASLDLEDISRCVACGMNGWMTKPVGLVQLREVLCCWLPPPQSVANADRRPGLPAARTGTFPSRASLIEAFGSWDVVAPMLFSLIHEAHADLTVLIRAQASLDARLAAHCLHRLVGSVAFLGETTLEGGAVALINDLPVSGVARNQSALDTFRQDVEQYLDYLDHL